jgi:hypothetical protein
MRLQGIITLMIDRLSLNQPHGLSHPGHMAVEPHTLLCALAPLREIIRFSLPAPFYKQEEVSRKGARMNHQGKQAARNLNRARVVQRPYPFAV